MATTATRNANTLYLEASGGASTIDALAVKNIVVTGIIITSAGTAETLTLRDVTTTALKVVLKGVANSTINILLEEAAILFPNGIRATLAQTDSNVTLIIQESRG